MMSFSIIVVIYAGMLHYISNHWHCHPYFLEQVFVSFILGCTMIFWRFYIALQYYVSL